MPIIPVHCSKKGGIPAYLEEGEYESIECVKVGAEEKDSEEPPYELPDYDDYLSVLESNQEQWRDGSDIYCFASSRSSRGITGIVLLMALAELEEVKREGGFFSIEKDKDTYDLAGKLCHRQLSQLGLSDTTSDWSVVLGRIDDELKDLSSTCDKSGITDITSYEGFTQKNIHYTDRVYIAKTATRVRIATPTEAACPMGWIVLGRKPKNKKDLQNRMDSYKRHPERSDSRRSFASTNSDESSLSIDEEPASLLRQNSVFTTVVQPEPTVVDWGQRDELAEELTPEIFRVLATYNVFKAIVSFIAKLLAAIIGIKPQKKTKPESVFDGMTSILMAESSALPNSQLIVQVAV